MPYNEKLADRVDCGGTVRNEEMVNFQLFEAGDYDHRLAPEKLAKVIVFSEKMLNCKIYLLLPTLNQ